MSRGDVDDPVIVLAPEQSCGSLMCAALGQHPQMYGLLETHLFTRNEMFEWMSDFRGVNAHGLVRSVAEIIFGRQSEGAVRRARHWLFARANRSTLDVFSELAANLYPLLLVEGSPTLISRSEHMCRLRRLFPESRYIHLVLHPELYGRLLVHYFRQSLRKAPGRTYHAIWDPESIFFELVDNDAGPAGLNPYRTWHRRHSAIRKFLSTIPNERQRLVRIEDLLSDPRRHLSAIVSWLGLRNDDCGVGKMTHPEQSPFARPGPPSARFGADPNFLRGPCWQLPASSNGQNPCYCPFAGEVEELARHLGY